VNSTRAEIRKLTSLRLPWVAVGFAVVLSGALGWLYVHVAPDGRVALAQAAVGVAEPAWFFVMIVAVLAAASEFQHRTVVTTLLATPRRSAVLVSKALASTAFGVVLTAAAVATAIMVGAVTAVVEDVPLTLGTWTEAGGALGGVALGGLWAVVATSIGLLTRSTALALTAVLVWRFVLEGIVPVVARNAELSDWMPSGAGAAVIGAANGSDMSALLGGVVVVGYAALLAALAGASFVRRDPQ
jgi:ABC-2 type transport system permease protein